MTRYWIVEQFWPRDNTWYAWSEFYMLEEAIGALHREFGFPLSHQLKNPELYHLEIEQTRIRNIKTGEVIPAVLFDSL